MNSFERSEQRTAAIVAAVAVALGALAPVGARAQSGAAAGPRAADGHVDLNGIWDNGAGIDFVQPQKRGASICVVGCKPAAPPAETTAAAPRAAPAEPSKPRYRPEFQAKVADLAQRQVETDPVLRCFSPGLPRIGPPDQIVQQPNQLVFLYDDVTGNYFRVVPTDGKPRPSDGEPKFLGDAVGHWEGDTLVIETANFNDQTWLTDDGAFHTKDLRVVERLKRNGDTLEWDATAYDPSVLAEPWHVATRIAHRTDEKVAEAAPCIERDLTHIVDGSHHPNAR